MNKIFDISWPISQATTGYKDRNIVKFHDLKNFDKDGVRETDIQLSSHTGTHVDAPSHFFRDGKTIDEITLNRLVGNCVVLDLTSALEKITDENLASFDIKEGDIVLLKTMNSSIQPTDKFSSHFVYLHESGAVYLKQKKDKSSGH